MERPPPQDDPDLVRREYADPSRLQARRSLWGRRTGPRVGDVELEVLRGLTPRRVLEVGCGPGDFAERLQSEGFDVVALDQSERMVELAGAGGVEALVGDVRELPFADRSFDVVVANFMLYHVAELDRALRELARVAPALVAATMGYDQLREMWELVGRDVGSRQGLFMRETGERLLRPHYREVRMIDLPATVTMSAADMRDYIASSVAHRHLADRVPGFEGTRDVTASMAVFVASHGA